MISIPKKRQLAPPASRKSDSLAENRSRVLSRAAKSAKAATLDEVAGPSDKRTTMSLTPRT